MCVLLEIFLSTNVEICDGCEKKAKKAEERCYTRTWRRDIHMDETLASAGFIGHLAEIERE